MSLTINVAPAGSRRCGDCTLCCKLVPVASLQKRAGEKCRHMNRKGCKVYDTRPIECMVWSCAWLADPEASGLHRPDRAHYVVDQMPDTVRQTNNDTGEVTELEVMQVWLDDGYPDAHRDPALRAFIEHVGKTRGRSTIVRRGNASGRFLVPPSLSPDGQWHEREVGKPNPNFGRYSRLPESMRPPL